ncbi:putative leucine-rich repeat-containing protein DDB_G0290503 [Colletes gigas]|uniref:putative leucine-rich repeat-containing protein DDB_G0290503 n=1 Tax=Colletes gigas TaxID=935657 RepID=UPI001C9A8E0C|nr:putative leucine-rich repeat-containing protein DDB_G0290503 [Colletes gigas]
MEQVDEAQIVSIQIQPTLTVDLSSLSEIEPNNDHVTNVVNISDSQGSSRNDCTDNAVKTVLSVNECDTNNSTEKIEVENPKVEKVTVDLISGLVQETVDNNMQEASNNDIEEVINNNTQETISSNAEERVNNNTQDTINNDTKETFNNDTQMTTINRTQTDADQGIKNDVVKDANNTVELIEIKDDIICLEEVSSNEGCTKLSNNVAMLSTDSGKDEQSFEKDICTVKDTDTSNDTNAQCQALIQSLSQTFDSKDQSLHVADTDTDLNKLVDGDSEVMVVTVETVPINDSNETTEQNIIVTVHEKDIVVNSNENEFPMKGKATEKTEIENEKYNLIDYSQGSDGTIIEVISTEVVDSDVSKMCTRRNNNEIFKHATSKIDSVTSTTTEVTDNITVNEDKMQTKYNVNEENNIKQVKTETCDSSDKNNMKKQLVHSKIIPSSKHINVQREGNVSVNEVNKVSATVNKRSVLQDIFDDWGDENAEDESQSVSKVQDTVEIELKCLLDDIKTTEMVEEDTPVLIKEDVLDVKEEVITNTEEVANVNKEMQISKEQTDNNQSTEKQEISITTLTKDQINLLVSHNFEKLVNSTAHEGNVLNQTSSQANVLNQTSSQANILSQISPQAKLPPIVIRGRNLTGQIASPDEVKEALKERLREKQKIVEAPPGPDIFFVKKLTQRLSNKLAGGPITSLPALIPLPQPTTQSFAQSDKKSTDNVNTETNKESSSDNKELLAILEGDVDPDWSNLKPPTLTEESKDPLSIDEHSTPPKLDPLIERELALKQLLELPVSSVKKNVVRKKKTFKPAPGKASKDVETTSASEVEKKIVNIDLIDDSTESTVKDTRPSNYEPFSVVIEQHTPEKNTELNTKDVRLDESRSGRKRKLTEKAREHEQLQSIVKRQKVYKSKVPLNKKQNPTDGVQTMSDTSQTIENHVFKENTSPASTTISEADATIKKEETDKQPTDETDITLDEKPENTSLKRSKQSLSKKGAQSIPKKNIVVKKILKQNLSSNKKDVALKAKLNTSSKKSGSKMSSKSKRSAESNSGDPKPKKKIINEIDRLLQDEGVVNLLYDVEQPDKKRLIPITKSQAKVMDIQKVQRELNFRKKLVRNAVLRLRTATVGVSKVSPRSKRTAIHLSDIQMDKKIGEQITPAKSNVTPEPEFILPAKIRNAADASIIIRRHSSSSFSSASGSPRVSVDSLEKADVIKTEEGGSHSLRSMKRRPSQDEGTHIKKNKKKVIQKVNTEIDVVGNVVDDKAVRLNKKSDSKKADKNSKQVDTTVIDETGSNSGKVITRSNGTTTGKVTSKTKKTAKSKVTFAKAYEPDNNEESSKGEDELSACLAEAANALSVVSGGNRSGNTTANRKNKANTNISKVLELDNNKIKTETRRQFSNKEISVRRHGRLVQLILTPSSSTKIRNALTLQMMQEFRETLSILKKDDDCKVVLLTSTGSSFCEGLELSMLLHTNKDERRVRAEEIADAVKDFIQSLASFNKPIVAGVQGAAVGLGVTMLPLFDLVIASDKATFSTPYGKLGQIAEGASIFTLSHILGTAIASELLLGGRTLTASEALRAGLVTRVLWPDRFQVELLPTLKAMSEQSSQSMEATKALLRQSLRTKLDAALESETYLLIQHWCSAECQTAIKAYIDGKVQ